MLVGDFSDVVQMRSPVSVVFQVFCEMFGEENVSGIAAVHDALCNINSSSSEIGLIVHICEWIYRSTVNTHSYFEFRMALQRLADLQRAFHWGLWIICKHEHHPIARRQTRQLSLSFSSTELLGLSNNLIELLNQRFLFVGQQL